MKTKLNQSKLKLAILSAMLVGSTGLSTAVYAAQTSGDNMIVNTNVLGACVVEAAQLTFATYDPTAVVPNLAQAVIKSVCTLGSSAKLTMNQGTKADTAGGSTDAAPLRRMLNTADGTTLAYSLYQDSSRTVVWGNTTGTGKGFTAEISENPVTVYGKIVSGLAATPGSFVDSVHVTLTY